MTWPEESLELRLSAAHAAESLDALSYSEGSFAGQKKTGFIITNSLNRLLFLTLALHFAFPIQSWTKKNSVCQREQQRKTRKGELELERVNFQQQTTGRLEKPQPQHTMLLEDPNVLNDRKHIKLLAILESPKLSFKNEAENDGVSKAKATNDAVELVKVDLGKRVTLMLLQKLM
ncbi:hypothetical protein GOP47_0006455 [Adiantum capillus-veneris]|uniref:Uncharacterized protein n=1 Tax=Adiantum capillus-veneris TaxID=13818 RepID=A0A9D4V3B2_ADICA|nr:hypothetical protein GOP47_0006455 [Adiantum capillus-veneris]